MPKISKETIVWRSEGDRKHLQVQVKYNAAHLFHFEIPEEFTEVVESMGEKERSKSKIGQIRQYKYREGWKKWILTDSSVKELVDHAAIVFKELTEKRLEKRNVILVWTEAIESHGRNRRSFSKTGLSLEFSYVQENKVGEELSYKIVEVYEAFGETKTQLHSISNHEVRRATMIDDTPENRAKLEQIHGALKTLAENVSTILQDPEKIAELVANDVKLIGS